MIIKFELKKENLDKEIIPFGKRRDDNFVYQLMFLLQLIII